VDVHQVRAAQALTFVNKLTMSSCSREGKFFFSLSLIMYTVIDRKFAAKFVYRASVACKARKHSKTGETPTVGDLKCHDDLN
jgi:hypothetical protein